MPEAENPPQCRYLPDASRPVAARGPSGGGTGICSLPNRTNADAILKNGVAPALRAAAHRRRIHGSFRIRSAQPAKNGTCQKAAEDVLAPDAATPAVFRTGRRARIAAFPPHEPGRSQKEAQHSVSGTNASGMLHDASATIPTESTAAFPAADTHTVSSFPRISSAFVVNKRASPVPQDFYTLTYCNYLYFYFSLL